MTIFCAGLNHRIADLNVREHFAVSEREMGSMLERLRGIEGLSGAVMLSTCNRVELYATTLCPMRTLEGFHTILQEHVEVNRKHSMSPLIKCARGSTNHQSDSSNFNQSTDQPTAYSLQPTASIRPVGRIVTEIPLYHHTTPGAVRHLFRVASGLDSMVLGETEIFGQVKKAYSLASGLGSTTRPLHRLFQHAFRVAKSVRTETQITRGASSVGSVAVELAEKIFGKLEKCRVMILGAGEVSERTARSLQSRGVRSVIVSNRTYDRAAALAAEIGGMALHFDHWEKAFNDVDIIISSTGAPHAILTVEKIKPLLKQRQGRPLFVIDLAVPRDADPAIHKLDGVFLYDIDNLQQLAAQSLDIRRQEVARCESLIEGHVSGFLRWMHAREK